MTDSEAILNELKSQSGRLTEIERAIQSMAVQDNKILTLQEQVHDLYSKHNETFGPEGVVSKMVKFQASCPRSQMSRLWWAIGIVVTGGISMFGVVFMIISKMGA